jgi:hypothetical protein
VQRSKIDQRMAEMGHERHFRDVRGTSALTPNSCRADFEIGRPVPFADIGGQAKAKEKALAEHVARHPEDIGRTVKDFNWIVRTIVRPTA